MKRFRVISLLLLLTVVDSFSQDIFKLIEQDKIDSVIELTKANSRFFTLRNNLGETPLMVACKNKKHALIAHFAENKGKDFKINNGSNALFFAADIKSFQLLMLNGFNINDTNNLGENCLFRLADAKNSGLLKQVLDEFNPNVNKSDIYSGTPLMKAVVSGDYESVQVLLEKVAAINRFNNKGFSPLIYAALSGNIEITKLLVMSGANLNASRIDEFDNPNGSAILRAAENNTPFAVMEILLNYGANPNVMNKSKTTPLMFAAEKNNYDLFAHTSQHLQKQYLLPTHK